MLLLRTFGGLSLENGGRPIVGAAGQRRRLALLAVLAVADDRLVSRDRLCALFWPESDTERARGALKQALYALRRDVGELELTIGTGELRLNPDVITSDVIDFERALAQGNCAAAVAVYPGPFLDGIHIRDAPEFERWTDDERARLARRVHEALEALAVEATLRGDQAAAGRWWRLLADLDPLGGRQALGIVASLLALGDRPSALRHAEAYRTLLAAELGLAPDAEMEKLIATIRAAPPRSRDAAPTPLVVERPPPLAAPIEAAIEAATEAMIEAQPEARTEAPLAAPLAAPLGPPPAAPFPALLAPPVPASRVAPRSRTWPTWASIAATATIVAAVPAAWWIMQGRTPPPLDPRRVAILQSRRIGGDTSSASFDRLVVEGVVRRLTSADVATPVVLSSAADADSRDAARRAGAGVVVTVGGDSGRAALVAAALTDARTGVRLWEARPMPLAPGSVGAADSLAERIATAVAVHIDPRLRLWIGASSTPVSLDAYREFSRGLALYGELEPSAATAHFRAAARDTGFTMALIMTAWSNYYAGDVRSADSIARLLQPRSLHPFDRAMVNHQVAVFDKNVPAAYEAAQAIAAAAPGSEWRYLLAESAMPLGRAREAARVLEAMGPDLGWLGGSSLYWVRLGQSLHFLGEHERELAAMQEAKRRFPANRIISQYLLKALAALGRVAEVEAEVDRALTLKQKSIWGDNQPMDQTVWELRAHGYPDAARRIAVHTVAWFSQRTPEERRKFAYSLREILVLSGHPLEAKRAAAALVREGTGDLDALAFLARLSAEQGDPVTARKIDARLARLSDPRIRVQVLVARAGIAASLEEREAAVLFLQDACRAGWAFRNIFHMLPEFFPLRGYAPFDRLARPVD